MIGDDVNPISIARAFLQITQAHFGDCNAVSEPNQKETQMAEELFVKFAKMTTKYVFVEESENDFEPGSCPDSCGAATTSRREIEEEDKENDPNYNLDVETIEPFQPDVLLKDKLKLFQDIKAHPNWTDKTLMQRHRKYNHRNQRARWEKHVRNGGTKNEILYQIEKHTLRSFKEARDDFKPVHDIDLRRWALQRASEYPSVRTTFKASEKWVRNFKTRNRISSRKVSKLVSKRNLAAAEDILRNVESFRTEILKLQDKYKLENIWNTDQTGFEYEYVEKRTLSWTGEEITFGAAFSPGNKTTHSYTAQPIITAAGELLSPMFVVLQEPSGEFGPQVSKTLFKAPNIVVTCTKSGKLTSSSVRYFFNSCAKPNLCGEHLLLQDSWGGQKDENLYADLGDGNKLLIKTIPKNGTKYCQPCDVYFNRQFKYFVKYLKAFANTINRDTNSRNDTLKIMSFCHFIFISPKFKDMIRYSWIKSGLVDIEREYFLNVRDACFRFTQDCCTSEDCKWKMKNNAHTGEEPATSGASTNKTSGVALMNFILSFAPRDRLYFAKKM